MQLLKKDLDPTERLTAMYKLDAITSAFHRTALFYGKIIISERYLPIEQKSIQPAKMGVISK